MKTTAISIVRHTTYYMTGDDLRFSDTPRRISLNSSILAGEISVLVKPRCTYPCGYVSVSEITDGGGGRIAGTDMSINASSDCRGISLLLWFDTRACNHLKRKH